MNEDFLDEVGKDPRKPRSNFNEKPADSQNQPEEPPVTNDEYKEKINKNIKKGCVGCLTIFVFLMLIGYCADRMLEPEGDDLRYELFEKDVAQLTSNVSEDEPLTMIAKKCIESSIYIETQEKKFLQKTKTTKKNISKNTVEYFTRINENKLLVLVKLPDLGKIESSTKDVFFEALLECYSYVENSLGIEEYFIGVQFGSSSYMVEAPEKYEDAVRQGERRILPFYDEMIQDSLSIEH